MDSVTQAVLGAVIGELCLGRKLGHKAALWGAWLGTVPDLDVLFLQSADELARLSIHRGLSHSLFFLSLTAPLWAYLIKRIHHRTELRFAPVLLMTWLALVTHSLVDCFTIYGVEILQPFSNWKLSFSNLFVVDPLFTLPLLLGLVAALRLRAYPQWGHRFCALGLALGCAYVGWSFSAQQAMRERAQTQLAQAGFAFDRLQVMPTPGNTLLWRALAANEESLWIGYTGLLDDNEQIEWLHIPRNQQLLSNLRDTEAVQSLQKFSGGFDAAAVDGGQLLVADLRFGELQRQNGSIQPISVWRLSAEQNERGTLERLGRNFSYQEITQLGQRFKLRVFGHNGSISSHSQRIMQEAAKPSKGFTNKGLMPPLEFANVGNAEQKQLQLSGLLCTP